MATGCLFLITAKGIFISTISKGLKCMLNGKYTMQQKVSTDNNVIPDGSLHPPLENH